MSPYTIPIVTRNIPKETRFDFPACADILSAPPFPAQGKKKRRSFKIGAQNTTEAAGAAQHPLRSIYTLSPTRLAVGLEEGGPLPKIWLHPKIGSPAACSSIRPYYEMHYTPPQH